MTKLGNKLIVFLSLIAILMLPACARKIKSSKLSRISLGMNKQELQKTLGEPSVIRGSMVNNFQQTIETWEYLVDRGFSDQKTALTAYCTIITLGLAFPLFFTDGDIVDPYWFFFCENKLVKWCRAGDWETIQHEIKEVRFKMLQ